MAEILWDFVRQIDANAQTVNTTSYFTTDAQAFFVKDGKLQTAVSVVEQGQWENSVYGDALSISDATYSAASIEHLYNGAVYGSADINGTTKFFLYLYMHDATDWLDDGYWVEQPDNPIKAGNVVLQNVDPEMLEDPNTTIFAPGVRCRLQFKSGDSTVYEIGSFYMAGAPYDIESPTIAIKGRNKLGYLLADQTFDELIEISGTYTEIVTAILAHAGFASTEYIVDTSAASTTLTFKPSQVLLDGLEVFLPTIGWYIDDLPDGTIIVGSASFMRHYKLTAVYEFDRGADCVSYPHKRDIDGVYNRVCVYRKEYMVEDEIIPARAIYADVPYFDSWFLGLHRTYHYNVPEETTNALMDSILTELVSTLQYSGIVETVHTLFRPWLQLGDVGVVTEDGVQRLAGIVTSIEHRFGTGGFFTEFTITSGGEVSNPDNPATIAVKYAGKLGGANREKRLLDYIKSGASGIGSYAGGAGSGTGVDGVNGLSAYQIWRALGNTGTEQDFIDSLQGADGADGTNGVGIPTGGTAGQIIVKNSATDYDTVWDDLPEDELPTGGLQGQVLGKLSDYDDDVGWVDQDIELPVGGFTGQVLAKKTDSDFDVEWIDIEDLLY